MLQIKCFYFNPFRECCTVASDESGEAVIVDPGCYDDQELDTVTSYVGRNGYKVVKILLTHGHFDHLFGVTSLAGLYDVPVLMISGDMDPVGNYGKGVRTVHGWLRDAGIQDLELILYPGARHEVVNETCRQKVYDDLTNWLAARFSM